MRIKSNKGVTLIALTLIIVVITIITSISMTEGLQLMSVKRVNYMNADIQMINTAISDYYLKYNDIPTMGLYAHKSDLISLFGGEDYLNPNDGDEYYVIDLPKLDNLTLNYGKDYKTWNSEGNMSDYTDLYIINKVTHQVYYVQGTSLEEKTYYTTQIS